MTAFDDKNQLEINFSNNIYLEKENIIISENSHVEYICQTKADFHMVLDCEYFDDIFIPFDLIFYNDEDLRHKSYTDQINILNESNFEEFNNKIIIKKILLNLRLLNLIIHQYQTKVSSLLQMDNHHIMTINTTDLRFNGRYFYTCDLLIKKSTVNLPFSEYKEVNSNKNITEITDNKFYYYYYHEQVEIIDDNGKTSNSVKTFNRMLIAFFQKVNLEIFSPSSTVLIHKYHNIIKQNILHKYKSNLLDIGTENGGDLHTSGKISSKLFERISKSEIHNRISICQNTIQNTKLKDIYNVATCFFTLNDFTYKDIENMLDNISRNINRTFVTLFFYMIYLQSIIKNVLFDDITPINNLLNKESPFYLLSTLRYLHKEFDNIIIRDKPQILPNLEFEISGSCPFYLNLYGVYRETKVDVKLVSRLATIMAM
ncbi:hypothetical protein H8356DRAFT_1350871 [Neocallimastix lanati (nom. inval.)]|nr:hypothetical protein H8356DRAFT_1350871 [Neocallimastix sp. JGI-2020a]